MCHVRRWYLMDEETEGLNNRCLYQYIPARRCTNLSRRIFFIENFISKECYDESLDWINCPIFLALMSYMEKLSCIRSRISLICSTYWNRSWSQSIDKDAMSWSPKNGSINVDKPHCKLVCVVPAPPWWIAAAIFVNSQLCGRLSVR